MVKRSYECDPNRLRSYLDDELSADEQVDLAGHLDHCTACQAALERLAAASRLWDDLRGLNRTVERPMPGRPIDPTGGDRRDPDRSRPADAGAGVDLDFLAPPEHPGSLGRLGTYEILGVLGQGGMGVVLRALDPALSRVVAIKVVAPQMAASGAARKRFFREAKAAAAVVHDHVVAIYAVDEDPHSGLPYLVMPYIAGRSLQERIDRDGPLRIEEILRIGMQTAHGLSAAHAQGLVHRDIKPSNILLENGVERVKITDFGLARAIDDASRSQSGVVAGTPQYMSPEQADGESVDHRSDLFSLGSVLYAMCAGHSPFRAKTTMGVLRRVCDEEPRPLAEVNSEVPASLEMVIRRLHAKDPAGRYQSAAEVAEVLGRQLAELQRPGSRPARPSPKSPGVGAPAPSPRPAAKPVGLTEDWEVPRSKPRSRVPKRIAIALLGLFALTAAAVSLPFAPRAHEAEPPWITLTVTPQAGQGQPPANVTITRQNPDDRQTIIGSGKPATKGFDLADFSSVEIAFPFRAEVTRADRFAVTVTADDNVLDHIRVVKDGGRLRIGLEDNRSYQLRRNSLAVAIAMPALDAIDLTHGARATIRGFESRRPLTAKASHGSFLEGTIAAGRLVLDASHGSEMDLKGTTDSARLEAAHGSTLPLDGLVIRDAEVELSHGSTAWIHSESEKGLRAEIHHGSTLAGVIRGGTVDLEAGHGARAILKGSARTAKVNGGHSSEFRLGGLAVETANVHLGHSSSATVRAANKLDYHLEFSSSLKYHGSPTIGASSKSHGSSARAVGPDDRSDEAAEKAAEDALQSRRDRRRAAAERPGRDGNDLISINLGSWGNGNHNISVGPTAHDTALIEGSGRPATRTVDVKDFTAIQIAATIQAEVTRADAFRVSLTADDNVVERIEAVRDGSTLRIRLAPGRYRLREKLRAAITLPALEGIEVTGASRATVQGFESDRPFRGRASGASTLEGSIKAGDADFEGSGASTIKLGGSARAARLDASGASTVNLADFAVGTEKLMIEASGASTVRLRGTAKAAVLRATGASQLRLADLALDAADIVLEGASNAAIRVKDLLKYDVTSASHLEYLGEPTIKQAKKTGASSVSHRR
jgi:eukaryotic-like serine/threonine-protein kinase